MTDAIKAAIEASRDREKAYPGDRLNKLVSSAPAIQRIDGAVEWEPRFREALAVSMEVFELAPKECTCTANWVCPHCLLKAALASVERILAGEK